MFCVQVFFLNKEVALIIIVEVYDIIYWVDKGFCTKWPYAFWMVHLNYLNENFLSPVLKKYWKKIWSYKKCVTFYMTKLYDFTCYIRDTWTFITFHSWVVFPLHWHGRDTRTCCDTLWHWSRTLVHGCVAVLRLSTLAPGHWWWRLSRCFMTIQGTFIIVLFFLFGFFLVFNNCHFKLNIFQCSYWAHVSCRTKLRKCSLKGGVGDPGILVCHPTSLCRCKIFHSCSWQDQLLWTMANEYMASFLLCCK